MKPLLEVKDLKKHYPIKKGLFGKQVGAVKAVDGVSFSIQPGETLGIVGESGCGKSTTGRAILRLIEPTAGEVLFDGQDIRKLPPDEMRKFRTNMQIVFQDPYASLDPRWTVQRTLEEPLRTHLKLSEAEIKDRIAELMSVVGLAPYHASRFPHEFSGGQRQRIGIARALALRPKFVVCDEPVSALDVSIQSQVLNLLKKLQKELKLTYIFIAHGLPAVKHISDRIAVMYLGKIVELAERDELFANPRHPYTEALLSAVPIPDPTQRKERIVLQGDLPNPANPPSGCHFHTRCPYVQDVCRQTAPTLTEGAAGHFVSCHFPLAQSQEGVMG